MTCTLHVAWDERLTDYHFGPGHPMAPVRVELTMRLAHEFGLWNQPGVTEAAPAAATDAELQLVHDPSYITAVEAISRRTEHPDAQDGLAGNQPRVAHMFGLATEDNPVFPACTKHQRW
jgi:acetoin utilization protein AcuC